MKTKIIILGVMLALVPTVANARGYHLPKPHKISSVGKYNYVYHRTIRIHCPYQGCKASFSQYTGSGKGYNN